MALTFIDHPELAAAITDATDLQVLTTSQLRTPLTQADLTAPSPGERTQVDYWQPETIGDLLFNYWDQQTARQHRAELPTGVASPKARSSSRTEVP